jgi:hypothetical protein
VVLVRRVGRVIFPIPQKVVRWTRKVEERLQDRECAFGEEDGRNRGRRYHLIPQTGEEEFVEDGFCASDALNHSID